MKRNDIIVIVALALLFVAWPYIDSHFIAKMFPPEPKQQPVAEEQHETRGGDEKAGGPDRAPNQKAKPAEQTAIAEKSEAGEERPPVPKEEAQPNKPSSEESEKKLPPPQFATLQNSDLKLTLTSHGGAIARAVVNKYQQTEDTNSPPVEMSFTNAPSLVYEDLAGFGQRSSFELIKASKNSVSFEKKGDNGLVLRRNFQIGEEGYLVTVHDRWQVAADKPVSLDNPRIRLGSIQPLPNVSGIRGMEFLGVDSLSRGGDGVQYWGKELDGFFEEKQERSETRQMPFSVEVDPLRGERSVDWMAVKNKFFTEILTPTAQVECGLVRARRKPTKAESPTSDVDPGDLEFSSVGAAIALKDRIVEPGKPLEWSYSYYVGPKKLSALEKLSDHKADVMQLGWLSGISKILLKMLNGIHSVTRNYGLAIITLTFIIKLIFWPITHKGMQGMRRMQAIQPEMNAVKEKYKDDKQKQQEEMAKLWKKHKVNPLGGCLPLLVQIPVFIALFTVLRSAIELRFSHFLWIKDLSEPEHLFNLGFSIPILGEYFNSLPILMAVTMFLQQKMTPSTGDAQQQKMMAIFMPIMIFVMLYNFPSGLILYWTTNQIATIVGQSISRKRHAGEESPA